MPPVRWETMAYPYQDVGINDDNFGMACVIVHRIFIFLLSWLYVEKNENSKIYVRVFVQIVYFNTYDSVYVLDFYIYALFEYERISKNYNVAPYA